MLKALTNAHKFIIGTHMSAACLFGHVFFCCQVKQACWLLWPETTYSRVVSVALFPGSLHQGGGEPGNAWGYWMSYLLYSAATNLQRPIAISWLSWNNSLNPRLSPRMPKYKHMQEWFVTLQPTLNQPTRCWNYALIDYYYKPRSLYTCKDELCKQLQAADKYKPQFSLLLAKYPSYTTKSESVG